MDKIFELTDILSSKSQANGDLMRSFLASITTLILGVLIYWIISSPEDHTWKWLGQFRNSTIETIKMMSSNSNNDIMPENHTSNHSIVKSPLISQSRDEQESIGNHALRFALGGASPSSQSLGLGSNCSVQEGDNATNESSSEATSSSDPINQTALSQNITVRKSMASSQQKKRVDKSVGAEGNDDPSKSPARGVELQFPEHIKTASNNLLSSPVSPMMSPHSLRLSDGFERTSDTNYASPLIDPDIAGLSPILTSRESDIRNSPFNPPVEPRRNHSILEILVTHPEAETSNSTSSRIDSSRQRQDNPNDSHEGVEGTVSDASITWNSDRDSAGIEHASVEKEQSGETDVIDAFQKEHRAEMPKVLSDETRTSSFFQETQENCNVASRDSCTCNSQQDDSDKKACNSDVVVDDDEATVSVSEEAVNREEESSTVASHLDTSQSCNGDQSIKEAPSPVNHQPKNEQSQESVVSTYLDAKAPASTIVDRNASNDEDENELHASVLSANDMPRDLSCSGASTKNEDENTISSSEESAIDMEAQQETTIDFYTIGEVEIKETDSADDAAVEIASRKELTGTYRDLTSAKKNLDASSMAFIERLRGAAHRRKLRVARSRDSLAAKEKEHLLSIASANERRQLMASKEAPVNTNGISMKPTVAIESSYKPFKARPVPRTTGQVGSGGQIGVPKVEKKPATTPFSPLLGARRPQTEKLPSINSPTRSVPRRSTSRLVSMVAESSTPKKSKSQGHTTKTTFKARPAPPTTGFIGQGGQVGVPKVPKRPVTIPVSPPLGIRRSSFPTTSNPKPQALQPPRHSIARKNLNGAKPFTRILAGNEASRAKEAARLRRLQEEADAERKAREFRARPMPKATLKSVSKSTESPVLFGLRILNQGASSTPVESTGSENVAPQMATPPRHQRRKSAAYEPHSTIRAKKRASFDERRALNEMERKEEEERRRKAEIKQRRAQLYKLRESI